MQRAAIMTAVAVVVGFGFGLLWGKQSRSRIGEAVSTDMTGGTLTVRVDGYKALREGLADVVTAKWGPVR